jgi:DNA-binding NarL/FixJ family response regulator
MIAESQKPAGGFRAGGEIRVAIVCGQRVFGESLALALDDCPNIAIDAVVGAFDDAALQSRRINIILVDLEGHEATIEFAVPEVRRRASLAGVIVLSSRATGDALHRSIESGADGHVSKEKGLAELRRAIYCVAGGVTYLGAHPLSTSSDSRSLPIPSVVRLSPREREVLRLLTQGYANRDIASALSLQHKTVKNHVSSILSKLESTSRIQAVIHALRQGIV